VCLWVGELSGSAECYPPSNLFLRRLPGLAVAAARLDSPALGGVKL